MVEGSDAKFILIKITTIPIQKLYMANELILVGFKN